MGRTLYYAATSLDGFIADDRHSLDWLHAVDAGTDGTGFPAFFAEVGAMAMGASTYSWLLAHDDFRADPGAAWSRAHGDTPCWVFTHRDLPRIPGRRSSSCRATWRRCTRPWPRRPVSETSGSSAAASSRPVRRPRAARRDRRHGRARHARRGRTPAAAAPGGGTARPRGREAGRPVRAAHLRLPPLKRSRSQAEARHRRCLSCAREDSNLRPRAPEARALSPELRALGPPSVLTGA